MNDKILLSRLSAAFFAFFEKTVDNEEKVCYNKNTIRAIPLNG
jgi:hypothetical protein